MTRTEDSHTAPYHIGIIMDGNRRWAKSRTLPAAAGHAAGALRAMSIVKHCSDRNISHLTLYALSTENLRRHATEVNDLFKIFARHLTKNISLINALHIRLRFIGDSESLPQWLSERFRAAEDLTRNNTGMNLTLLLNYGGRRELVMAIRRLISARPRVSPENVTVDFLSTFMWSKDLPELNLIIRPGGENRLSNFMLWHSFNAPLVPVGEMWPDCKLKQFL